MPVRCCHCQELFTRPTETGCFKCKAPCHTKCLSNCKSSVTPTPGPLPHLEGGEPTATSLATFQGQSAELNDATLDQARPAKLKGFERVNRIFVYEYLETHPCVDCGDSDLLVLTFDHLPQFEKSANISKMLFTEKSLGRIIEEIKKCEVVCFSCHAKRTAKRDGLASTRMNWKLFRSLTPP